MENRSLVCPGTLDLLARYPPSTLAVPLRDTSSPYGFPKTKRQIEALRRRHAMVFRQINITGSNLC